MKRYICTFISVLILFVNIKTDLFSLYAENVKQDITVSTVSALVGDTVDIVLKISNNPGIISLALSIKYDCNELKLISVDDKKLFQGASFTKSGDITVNPYVLLWDNALSKESNMENGIIAVMHFKVISCKDGFSEICIIPEDSLAFDINLNDVIFEYKNGGVSIKSDDNIIDEINTENNHDTAAETKIEESITTNRTTESSNTEDTLFISDKTAPISTDNTIIIFESKSSDNNHSTTLINDNTIISNNSTSISWNKIVKYIGVTITLLIIIFVLKKKTKQ